MIHCTHMEMGFTAVNAKTSASPDGAGVAETLREEGICPDCMAVYAINYGEGGEDFTVGFILGVFLANRVKVLDTLRGSMN